MLSTLLHSGRLAQFFSDEKKTSVHRRRSTTSTSSSRGTSSPHDDVAETVQFTRHAMWCDSWQLRLSLSLEPQLCSFDQRANVSQEAWPCRRLQEIDYFCTGEAGAATCATAAQCRSTTTLDKKKKNHPRDSRREERCSTCDIMLDQARSAQGKSRGQSRIGLALR